MPFRQRRHTCASDGFVRFGIDGTSRKPEVRVTVAGRLAPSANPRRALAALRYHDAVALVFVEKLEGVGHPAIKAAAHMLGDL